MSMSEDERPPDSPDTPSDAQAGDEVSRPVDRPAVAPAVRQARRPLWIAVVAGGSALALGVWAVTVALPGLLSRSTDPSPPPAVAQPDTEARRILATLFYVSDDGSRLVSVRGSALYGETPVDQARHIVEAQVQPPPRGQRSAIPAGTTVRTVFLTADGHAFVDLGGAIVSGHSGGSRDEALSVYAIVNAVTVNLPNVSAVQILVNGRQVDTLAGHLDLRHPLGKALDWVQKGS